MTKHRKDSMFNTTHRTSILALGEMSFCCESLLIIIIYYYYTYLLLFPFQPGLM